MSSRHALVIGAGITGPAVALAWRGWYRGHGVRGESGAS